MWVMNICSCSSSINELEFYMIMGCLGRRLHKTRTLLSNKINFKKTVRQAWQLGEQSYNNEACPVSSSNRLSFSHSRWSPDPASGSLRLSQASPSPSGSRVFPYVLSQSYVTSQHNWILTWSQGRSDAMVANAGAPLCWMLSYCPFRSALSSPPPFFIP